LLHLDLAVPTDWRRIDQVREAVGHCVAAVWGDRDLRDALSMVSAELLENAFKYGAPNQTTVRVSVRQENDQLVVAVTNAVDIGTPQAQLLAERVAWVNEFGDPQRAYEAALARAYTDESDASGLGLARILYEGGCMLDCDTSTAGRVTVSASCALQRL
jgi:hypothetical protein